MDIHAIEAKIRQLVEKSQKLEGENQTLRQELLGTKQQFDSLQQQKHAAIQKVEELLSRLKTYTEINL